jgi:ABC-type antimicrobial peptide transport system permease subunit
MFGGAAMVGLYGSVSYRVPTRASEFGVRVALGAGATAIVRLVMREVGVTLGIGVLLGLGLSLVAVTALRTLLYGIGPYDSATIGAAARLLALVAAFAGFFPARRASRLDPIVALRTELD